MRDFNDADRKKKRGRIQLPENPGNLSPAQLSSLEDAVKAAVKDGYVACPTGWRIAGDEGVSRMDVGVMIDKLGIRVTNCQLGCFKVSKTDRTREDLGAPPAEVARRVGALAAGDELTCPNIFAIARELGVKPMAVADAANTAGHKLRGCQLGCF